MTKGRHINIVTILAEDLKAWWNLRQATAVMKAYVAHQGVADRVALAREARQILRNSGWTDERIDPWMASWVNQCR